MVRQTELKGDAAENFYCKIIYKPKIASEPETIISDNS